MDRSELIEELSDLLGARHEARFIVEDATGRGPSDEITQQSIDRARALARRRAIGEPLQYVLGHWSFRSLDLLVDQRVLIPRPETEFVVEVALAELDLVMGNTPCIVDAGTGSGAIALSMAAEVGSPMTREGLVWATDISADALAVAAQNLKRVSRTEPDILQVEFIQGSWFDPIPDGLRGTIDVVVSNPPYVSAAEWDQLSIEVRQEPQGALVADDLDGTPGLADVVTVLTQSLEWLARPGAVVIELAPHQADAAAAIARAVGYDEVRVEPDLSQRPRVLVGRVS